LRDFLFSERAMQKGRLMGQGRQVRQAPLA